MKTQAEVDAFLASVVRWKDEHGDVANPAPGYLEMLEFKTTLDFSKYATGEVTSTADKAYKPDERGIIDERVTWSFDLVGLGQVFLHLYCMPDVEDMGYWAEFWYDNEPWWNGDDPYECTRAQLAVLVKSLPEEHLNKFVELASRKQELIDELIESGAIENPAPRP